MSLVSTVSIIRKALHPVFEMFYSNLYLSLLSVFNSTTSVPDEPCIDSVDPEIRKALHPVFEMFYSNLYLSLLSVFNSTTSVPDEPCIDSVDNPEGSSSGI